jgi:hypothetical protein
VSRRVLQLVADYGPGDLAFAELAQLLELVLPEAAMRLTSVPPGDSLAGGWCAARLALCPGPPGRLVVVDVAPSGPAHQCVGRTRDEVEVVAADTGWAWSFLAEELCGPYHLEVPAGAGPVRSPRLLAEAVVRVVKRQPHGVCEPMPADRIPRVPDSVVAFVDCDGNLETTIPYRRMASERVSVRIGDVAATALVTDGRAPLGEGALALQPGTRPYSALTVGGGSAAALFGSPRGGAPVALGPAEARA